MALTKEIWLNSIVGNLFADNSFAIRSTDHSGFVNNKTVHVPNAGAAPGVTKGRSTFPATVITRTDNDLNYNIDEFTTDPFRVPNAEKVELSYDKRESIIGASRSAIIDKVHTEIITNWVPTGFDKVMTSGDAVAAHLASATGNRKSMTAGDVLAAKILMDRANIPSNDRCILLDCDMYNQLLGSLSEKEAQAFLGSADAQRGVVGKLYGFDCYMRSTVLRTVANGSSLASQDAASDGAAGLAWQKDCVSRAIGEAELFERPNDPLYYGDVFSMLVRAGGHYARYDKKGVVVIAQASAA